MPAIGYAAASPEAPLAPLRFERRPLGPRDVRIEILHCGVCHSDPPIARNEWPRRWSRREKLSVGRSGPGLDRRHPGAAVRRARLASAGAEVPA